MLQYTLFDHYFIQFQPLFMNFLLYSSPFTAFWQHPFFRIIALHQISLKPKIIRKFWRVFYLGTLFNICNSILWSSIATPFFPFVLSRKQNNIYIRSACNYLPSTLLTERQCFMDTLLILFYPGFLRENLFFTSSRDIDGWK